ncbi:MAG TPA: tripartite tricarboxylate transporter substrate binding protein [Burkholderiales bacterium]|nr:tripartite tricarboxylate transporter substrate binding protein [Burkholderiales bacterium]
MRVTVGFAPGGGVDILARVVSQKLGETMGRTFVVENRPGAGGTTAYAALARAPADGYNLLAISASYTMSSALHRNLPYDPVKDFAPITLMGSAPYSISTHPSLPVKTVADLIALARAKPGELNFASGGFGSAGHMTGELFKSMARIRMTYIPYKGGELALIDLIAGQVHVVFTNLLTSLPHLRTGRVRVLAVTGARRHPAVPQIPTVTESGLPGYEPVSWYGWLAPAGTPGAIVARLNNEISGLIRLPDVQERFARDGADPVTSTPSELGERIVSELARWRKVVKESNLRVE